MNVGPADGRVRKSPATGRVYIFKRAAKLSSYAPKNFTTLRMAKAKDSTSSSVL